MLYLRRPWDNYSIADKCYRPSDCLVGELAGKAGKKGSYSILMPIKRGDHPVNMVLYSYPKAVNGQNPERLGFPLRPRARNDHEAIEDKSAHDLLRQMNEVLARVQELGEALEDPLNVWMRLGESWRRAENEEDPRMAEIVRQAQSILPRLKELEPRIRRILRRSREMVVLDRVQEMDRAAMRWLIRQPGNTTAERAGTTQRILATVRRENFDTPENRVLHAYVSLAFRVSRNWLQEHPRAINSDRFKRVDHFSRHCKALAQRLAELGIAIADANIIPNYVLTQDANYKAIYDAWRRLLNEDKVLDDLWAWQAETWTDFSVLAIVMALSELEDATLLAQSPIVWRHEASLGRWFEQDRPIAVFWLRNSDRIVEVQSRPEAPTSILAASRAHVSLRIGDLNNDSIPRRVAVWTPHALTRIDLKEAVAGAHDRLAAIQNPSANEILRNGLILTPSHGYFEESEFKERNISVDAIAFGAAGEDLRLGLQAIREFAHNEVLMGSS